MIGLLFGGVFRFDADQPRHPNNDRLIFSKGHASPLFYALWLAAGKVTEQEMMTLRKFGSPLEGHPTPAFLIPRRQRVRSDRGFRSASAWP